MIIYTNIKEEALEEASLLKKEEPDYAEDVEIIETNEDSFGMYARTDLGKFLIHNETE